MRNSLDDLLGVHVALTLVHHALAQFRIAELHDALTRLGACLDINRARDTVSVTHRRQVKVLGLTLLQVALEGTL